MTLDPAAVTGTTGAPPADGSGVTTPPGTTDPAAPAVGSTSDEAANRAARLEVDLAEERRKNAQLLAEKSNTEAERERNRQNQGRNERLEADLQVIENPGQHGAEQVADARWRVSMAAVQEANARAVSAERRAEEVEQRLTTSVPDKHRSAVDAHFKAGNFRSYEEAAENYELVQRRSGTWEEPGPSPKPTPAPSAASPAQRPVATVTRSQLPSTQPLPQSLPESQFVALKASDPARFELLRQARKSGAFSVTPG